MKPNTVFLIVLVPSILGITYLYSSRYHITDIGKIVNDGDYYIPDSIPESKTYTRMVKFIGPGVESLGSNPEISGEASRKGTDYAGYSNNWDEDLNETYQYDNKKKEED